MSVGTSCDTGRVRGERAAAVVAARRAAAATRVRGGCWSPATPAAPTAARAGCGRTSWPSSRPRPGWRSRCATSRPGPAKWNKIEHRLFCHITRTWRARPLMTAEDAVAGIAATTTYQGLKCTAVLDDGEYPKGMEISDERMKYLEDRILDRGASAASGTTRSCPPPGPVRTRSRNRTGPGAAPGHAEPPRADRPGPGGLHPGRRPGGPLRRPPRSSDNYTRRGGRRVNAIRNGNGSNGRTAGSTSPATCSPCASATTCDLPVQPHRRPARRRAHHRQPRRQPDPPAPRRQRHPAAARRPAARHPSCAPPTTCANTPRQPESPSPSQKQDQRRLNTQDADGSNPATHPARPT